MKVEEGTRQHMDRLRPPITGGAEGPFKLGRLSDLEHPGLKTQPLGGRHHGRGCRAARADVVPQEGEPRQAGNRLNEELKLLSDDVLVLRCDARDVPAGARKARYVTGSHRVGQDRCDDDRDLCCSSSCRLDPDAARYNSDVAPGFDQFGRQLRQTLTVTTCPAVFDGERLPLDPTQLAQSPPKRVERLRPGVSSYRSQEIPHDAGSSRPAERRPGVALRKDLQSWQL